MNQSLMEFLIVLIACGLTYSNPLQRNARQVAFPEDNNNNNNFPNNPFLRPPNQQVGPQVFPTQRPQRPSSTTSLATTDSSGTTTTTASPSYTACLAACGSTSEYNPVCGTDRVTYNNKGRLRCANQCGNNVQLLFEAACSPIT